MFENYHETEQLAFQRSEEIRREVNRHRQGYTKPERPDVTKPISNAFAALWFSTLFSPPSRS
ncbi:MAG: hypothetical protein K9L66_11895 [Spirochaetaceae bacterium]|nr:hypothetical protein [Spirochaetaceae bacterium]MCF7939792.1 hypothetical protein [Spirochaetales bacterium]